jgi:parvulin-like peptidyl-prolyl isomerase
MIRKGILGLLLVVLFMGCTTDKKTEVPKDAVAVVHGEKILITELDDLVNTYAIVFEKNTAKSPTDEEIEAIRANILESLIEKKVYLVKFDKLGLVFDEGSVATQIDEVKASFPTEEAFGVELKNNGFTLESFTDEVRFQLKMMALGDYIKNMDMTIEDEKIQEYYNTNKEMFYNENSALAEASHILITPDETLTDAEALTKITSIKAEIANGLSFADAAKQYSQCPSSNEGGFLGSFPPGAMVKEFDQEVFSMELNTVSEPIKTQFGYHLILTSKRNDNPYEPLENVVDFVKMKIKEETFIDESYKEANVQRATPKEA